MSMWKDIVCPGQTTKHQNILVTEDSYDFNLYQNERSTWKGKYFWISPFNKHWYLFMVF